MLRSLSDLLNKKNTPEIIKTMENALTNENDKYALTQAIPFLYTREGKNIYTYAVGKSSNSLINMLTTNNLIPHSYYNRKDKHENGISPLMRGVMERNYDFVAERLKKKSADVNDVRVHQYEVRPLLYYAIENEDSKMVRLLLHHNAPIPNPKEVTFYKNKDPFVFLENEKLNLKNFISKMTFFFWAQRNDAGSAVSNMPTECIQVMTNKGL